MKIITASMILGFLSILIWAQTANAHHSFAMFDRTQEKLIIGQVVAWNFNNPHSWLYVAAVDENGEIQNWGFEGAAQVHAIRQGVNGNTFHRGEMVKVVMSPLRSGEPAGAVCFVEKEDGTIARPNDGTCNSEMVAAKWQQRGWLQSAAHLDTFGAND